MSRPTHLTVETVAVGLAAALVLTGCTSQRPVDPDAPTSAEARATAVALADEADVVATEGTDLTENPAGHDTRSWDCSGAPVAGDKAVQWAADRQWILESGEATSELVQPLVDHFTEQGWQVTEGETRPNGYRHVSLIDGGYMIEVLGEQAARSGQHTQLNLSVISPCVAGPGAD